MKLLATMLLLLNKTLAVRLTRDSALVIATYILLYAKNIRNQELCKISWSSAISSILNLRILEC